MKKKIKNIVGLIMIFAGLAVLLGGLALIVANIFTIFEGISAGFIGGIVMLVLGGICGGAGFIIFLNFNHKDVIRASAASPAYAMIKKQGEAAEKKEEQTAKTKDQTTKKDAVK